MAETYYKLATFSPRTLTFVDGKTAYADIAMARAAAKAPGTYRISEVPQVGPRRNLAPFEVVGNAAAKAQARKQYPAHATRPMGGRPH